MALLETIILLGTRADQPVATAVGAGTLYSVTDEGNKLERSNELTWDNYGPTVSGSTTGNAATATALQTARTINTVSFNGTANIVVTAAAGTLTGATLAAGVLASSLTSVGTLATLTVTAPIVGSVTGASGSATGNAGTATALATGRAINGVTFDGTAAITVTAAAGTLTGATLAAGVLASSLTSVGTLATLTVTAAIVGSVTGASGSTSGNAATATALQTGRAINGVTFDGTAPITVTAAAGTLTGATLAAGVLASSLTSLGTIASLAASLITVSVPSLAGVSTDGAVFINSTAATVGATTQMSPRTRWSSTAWASTPAVAHTLDFCAEVLPVPGATAITGVFRVAVSLNGAGFTNVFSVSQTGVFTATSIASSGNVQAAAASAFTWNGRAAVFSPANGQVNMNVQNSSAGVGFDVVTDAVLKIRTRAQSAYATVDALGYSVSGAAGASKVAGPVTSITVVNGIVTACT